MTLTHVRLGGAPGLSYWKSPLPRELKNIFRKYIW